MNNQHDNELMKENELSEHPQTSTAELRANDLNNKNLKFMSSDEKGRSRSNVKQQQQLVRDLEDDVTTSYQNDNSVYYTPIYKVNNQNQTNSTNRKSLIEPNSAQHLTPKNAMDCSFDNSIVPVASCSSMSSERSSLNSTNIYPTQNHRLNNQTSRHHKKSSRRKDQESQHRTTHHQTSSKHHRRQRTNNHHLELSNNEQPSALSQINSTSNNQNQFVNNQSGPLDPNKSHHLNSNYQTQDQHRIADQNNAGNDLLFDHLSDPNSPSNTDDDSLPYFQTSSFNQDICNALRWKLKYYFMNPIEKWKAKKKFPWKLLLQIIKIIFVTIHVLTYGSTMSRFLNHQGSMLISFRELLLNNWDPVREVMAYPPSAGSYAVYTRDEFFENFDFAVKNFAKITKQATGGFGYLTNNTDEVSPIQVCFKNYVNGSMEPSQFIYNYNNAVKKKCYTLDQLGPAGSKKWDEFSFEKYLDNRSISLDFNRIIKLSLKFKLRTIYLNSLELGSNPECYDVSIKITYDNSQHCGQILIDLKANSFIRECNGNLVDKVGVRLHKYEKTFLRILVIILCLVSFTLCTRSLIKSHKLGAETKNFFKHHFRRHLTLEDQMEFYDFWIIMIILNDVFIMIGTILLEIQHNSNLTNFDYTTCTLFLGIGIFLVWTGILRYLSFFKKYNVVILTAKRAYPDIFRFLICVLLLYCAFCLCGWIILGPYHLKFRTLSKTSECLFSLLNGDDMFATFATTDTNNYAIWIFSRVYLYGFITIFIYIILSLFISIIMDAYETIKECYITGMPLSDLHKFISECDNNPPHIQTRHRHSVFSFRNCIRSCCHCSDNSSAYEGL